MKTRIEWSHWTCAKCFKNSHYFYTISSRKYKMKEPFLIRFMKLVLTLLPRPGTDNSKKEYRPISFISIEEKIS